MSPLTFIYTSVFYLYVLHAGMNTISSSIQTTTTTTAVTLVAQGGLASFPSISVYCHYL